MAARGDIPGAAQYHSRALRMSQEANHQPGIAQSLEGLANAASLRGEAERAAQLLGSAAALRAKISAPPVPPDRVILERIAERASRELGAEAFELAQAKGRALPLDQAIGLAFTD